MLGVVPFAPSNLPMNVNLLTVVIYVYHNFCDIVLLQGLHTYFNTLRCSCTSNIYNISVVCIHSLIFEMVSLYSWPTKLPIEICYR